MSRPVNTTRRLVQESKDRVVERAMDAVGNVYRRADGQDRRYGRGGLLEAANDERGAVTFTHDADGNRTTKHEPDGTHWTYRWNGHGFLAEVERRSDVTDAARASRVEPDLHLRFTYDAFARRVAKRVEADGDVRETRFVWDGHTVLHELRSVLPDEATLDPLGVQSGSLDTLALAPATLDTRDEPELTTWYWDPGTFTPVAKERVGRRWSITSDHLGTPTEMYDELGELAWRMQLDVFGVPTFEEGTAEDCPWRWPGQYDDVETGEFYNRWRYYDPESGRYTSLDPIRLAGGVSAFAYPDAPDCYFDSHGLAKEWMIHSPSQNDILQKGLHFHAPGRVELGVILNDGAIDFRVVSGSPPSDRAETAIRAARDRFTNDPTWRAHIRQRANGQSNDRRILRLQSVNAGRDPETGPPSSTSRLSMPLDRCHMNPDTSTPNLLENMLRSSINGHILGISVGDHLEDAMRAIGARSADFIGLNGRGFFEHSGAEISVGLDDRVSMIYVEVPDDFPMHHAVYLDDVTWLDSPDQDVLEANVGRSHIVIDRHTGNILSFAI